MKLSKEEVIRVAKLARLDLDDSTVDTLSHQVATILDYVDTLEKANTEGVEPTSHAITLTNAFREDVVKEHPGVEKALANAPEKEEGCFVVPKVVG